MKKKKYFAFGKDIYLLGLNKYNEPCYLEAPSWDCEWYWGFGYVEVYTNKKNPSKSKDISSHSHLDSLVLNKSVLSKEEMLEFKSLTNEFYKLRKEAGSYHRNNIDLWNKINKESLPVVMNRMIELLTP